MKNTVTRSDIDAILAASDVDVCTKFGKVTVVTVRLPNGFVLVEASGAVSKENYSEELGRQVCLDRIAQKLWSFEGYKLSAQIASGLPAIVEEISRLSDFVQETPSPPEQANARAFLADLAARLRAIS